MDRQTRWFRRLLHLLPADFQADYARDMERTFRTQRREALREGGAIGVVSLWWETLRDLARTAPREHLDQVRQDVRYTLRMMAERPGFAAVAVLVLGLGSGSTTAGRVFTADEDRPGAPPVAIVSHRLAVARFGSALEAVNQTLTIDGRPSAIVGVLPPELRFPDPDIEIWLPLGMLTDEPWMRNRAVHVVLPVGRLRRGVTLEDAGRELAEWMRVMQAREPSADPGHLLIARSLASHVSRLSRTAISALAGAVLVLLLVTCTSVGLLLLNRATARSGEMAIRAALGASRARLLRQLLTESLVLASAGGLLGMLAARALLELLVRELAESLPSLTVPSIDATAWVSAAAATSVAAIVSGTVPAFHAVRAPCAKAIGWEWVLGVGFLGVGS